MFEKYYESESYLKKKGDNNILSDAILNLNIFEILLSVYFLIIKQQIKHTN